MDAVYLSWAELSKINRLDLNHQPKLIKYRDLFIVGCLTGFRYGDYSTLNPFHLKDGMLHVRQEKTTQHLVVPLRTDAKEIFVDKYRMQMPSISLGNFNLYVKAVVKLAGMDEPVKITHKRGNKLIEEVKPK